MIKLATLALTTAINIAHAGQLVPVPGEPSFTHYFGNYGHVVRFRSYWAARPRMRGSIEEVRFFPLDIRIDGKRQFYRPSEDDFRLENLNALRLTSLMIIPRADSHFVTLDDVRKAKVEDLGAKTYRISEIFPFSDQMPKGSFEVVVEKPYRLRQAYTEDERYRYIVTTGDTDLSTEDLYRSLLISIADKTAHLSEDSRRAAAAPPSRLPLLHPATRPLLRKALGPLVVPTLILLLICLIGRVAAAHSLRLLAASHAAGLAAALISEAAWFLFENYHLGYSLAATMLLWTYAARRWGAPPTGKSWGVVAPVVGVLSTLYAILIAPQLATASAYPPATHIFATSLAAASWLAAWLTTLLIGSIRSAFPMALIFFAAGSFTSVSATQSSHEIRREALTSLLLRGISPENLEKVAANRLKEDGTPIYDLQRVEVTGILADADTKPVLPAYFEPTLRPSHRGSKRSTAIIKMPAWYHEILDSGADAAAALEEIKGMQSNAGKAALRPLQGKEINEIVAHSWGSEVVYNAIMTGFMHPPRSLIVVGAPDDDFKKWELLAQRTGTHVRMYWGTGDQVRIADQLAALRMPAAGKVDEREWDKHATRRESRAATLPGTISTHTLSGVRSHSRSEYYRELTVMGVIGPNINELEYAQRRRLEDAVNEIIDEEAGRVQEAKERYRREREDFKRRFQEDNGPMRRAAPIAGVDRGISAVRTAIGYCLGDTSEINSMTAHLRTWTSALTDAEVRTGHQLTGCKSRLFGEIVRLLSLPGAGANISMDALRKAVRVDERPPLLDAPTREGGAEPPPPGKGNDCFRGGDPFGCQPR